MNILDKIVAHKHTEVDNLKKSFSRKDLEALPGFSGEVPSLSLFLLEESKSGIIAEFKRKSPSKGFINEHAVAKDVVPFYEKAGASAISVLTDSRFFGGDTYDLITARNCTTIPILRKDFILDEMQILEARGIGASAILLIASILTKEEVHQLAGFARSLGLEVLFEIHNEEELQKLSPHVNVVGVNNRNLATFKVSIENSKSLSDKIPSEFVKISESGISNVSAIQELREYGFKGFLIGENFMKTPDPGQACIDFIKLLAAGK